MSEQKQHMDTVEQARKLLSDGDENYKLHTVIWLYQQSEKVAALTKENERINSHFIACTTDYQKQVNDLIEERADRIAELEKLKAELDQSEKNYLSAVVGRKDFREAFRKERTERHILESLLESEKTILSLRTKERDELVQELGKKSLTPYGEQLQEELSRLREEREQVIETLKQTIAGYKSWDQPPVVIIELLQSLLSKFNDSKT